MTEANKPNLADQLQTANLELREANKRLREMDTMRRAFMTTMSHELRTPLNAICNYVQLLADEVYGPLTPDQSRGIAGLRQCSDDLLAMINNFLDLSQIETGRLEIELSSTDVGALCRQAMATVRVLIQERPLRLVENIAPDLPESIQTDPQRLRQILLNLLVNAVKYTPSGCVSLEATREGAYLRIAVADTGIGIPAPCLERIFEPFFRVQANLVGRVGGTGLGLSVARRIARLLDTRITVVSQPGKGSTFTVLIPVAGPQITAGALEPAGG